MMQKLGMMACLFISLQVMAESPSLSSLLQIQKPSSQMTSTGGVAGDMNFSPATAGTVHFLEALFYSDAGCTSANLLGKATITDNNSGFSFTSGQTISLNSSSAYQLVSNYQNGLITPSNVRCMQLYLTGSNATPNNTDCKSYPDEDCSSGSKCVSSLTDTANWTTNTGICATARYAYFTNSNDNTVAKCTVDSSTGALSSCTAISNSAFSHNLTGISINNGYAYVVEGNGTAVVQCTVSSTDGSLSSCNSISGFLQPASSTVNTQYFYTQSFGSNTIQMCTIDSSTGALSSCGPATSYVFNQFYAGIAFNQGVVYIPNYGSLNVIKCTVNANGTFTAASCAPTATGYTFTGPAGITISNGYAYITDTDFASVNNVVECAIDPATHALVSCAPTGTGDPVGTFSGFNGPNGIGITNGYAYIENSNVVKGAPGGTAAAITKCTVESNGVLDNCVDAADLNNFNSPLGDVAFDQ